MMKMMNNSRHAVSEGEDEDQGEVDEGNGVQWRDFSLL